MREFMGYRLGLLTVTSWVLVWVMGCGQVANLENLAIASPTPPLTATPPKPPSVGPNDAKSNIPNHRGRSPQPGPAQKMVNPKLIAANTRFGFKLFAEILKGETGKNVFVSPSSVAMALAMTYNGAGSTTQTAMAKALELQGLSLTALNQANADLKTLLDSPEAKVQLSVANSLWARQGINFQPEFLERNRKFYGAQVTDLDFSDPQAPGLINHWASENTQGKINKIVDQLSPHDILFLVNAIYFKGTWSREFDPADTANKPFQLLDGSTKSQPMMSQSGDYKYYETDNFQAASLPYGKQGRVSLYLFLPKPTSSLAAFQKSLTAENWTTWMDAFRTRTGAVQIPRFKLEYGIELKSALSALGMAIAFDPAKANFSGLSPVPAHIDAVRHKTFVEVNEAGTEAAAVTAVGIRTTSVRMDTPFQLVADRPFFCAIRDNKTGTILFMGSIVEPK